MLMLGLAMLMSNHNKIPALERPFIITELLGLTMQINIPYKITDIKRSITITDVLLYLYLSVTSHINCIISH